MELFEDVAAHSVEQTIDAMQLRACTEKDVIFRQGQSAEHFFVRYSGEYDVFARPSRRSETVCIIRTYDDDSEEQHFGELDLLRASTRYATLICRTSGILFQLDRQTFMDIVT